MKKLSNIFLWAGLAAMSFSMTCQGGKLNLMGLDFGGDAYKEKLKPIITAYQRKTGNQVDLQITAPNEFTDGLLKFKADAFIGMDLILTDYGDLGLFADIGKILGPNLRKAFLPSMIDAYYANGAYFGIPVMGACEGLMFNRQLFKKSGLAEPTSNWSWTGQFYEAAVKLTRDTDGNGIVDQYGVLSPQLSTIYGFGGSVVDKEFKKLLYTEKPALQGLQFISKLYKEGLAKDEEYRPDAKLTELPFYDGKSAMRTTVCWTLDSTQFNKQVHGWGIPYDFGMTTVPRGPKGCVPRQLSSVAGIMKRSEKKPEAAAFIKFLASPEAQRIMFESSHVIPTTYDGLRLKGVTQYMHLDLARSYEKGKANSVRKSYYALHRSLWRDLTSVAKGEITIDDLVRNARENGPGILEQAKSAVF